MKGVVSDFSEETNLIIVFGKFSLKSPDYSQKKILDQTILSLLKLVNVSPPPPPKLTPKITCYDKIRKMYLMFFALETLPSMFFVR